MSRSVPSVDLEAALETLRDHLQAGRASEAATLVRQAEAELEDATVAVEALPRMRVLWAECTELAAQSLWTLGESMQRVAAGRRAVTQYRKER